MTTNTEAREEFWSALKSDMTVMLALGDQPTDAQPMTAQMLEDAPEGPIYFFTSMDSDLARAVDDSRASFFTFADKGHALFATVEGSLQIHNDRAVIEALWNPFVAAWFDGKADPKICLLRFDAVEAQIWFDAKSLIAGIKMLLGVDPKEDYKDKTARVVL